MWRGIEKYPTTTEWKEIAERIRRRDGYTCQCCGKKQQKKLKLAVDHIIPFRLTWLHEEINLLAICKSPCHCRKTAAEQYLLVGDKLTFIQKLREMNYPMDKVETALIHWGKTNAAPYPALPKKAGASRATARNTIGR